MNEQTLSKFCYILRHMTEVTSYEIKIISLVLMMKPDKVKPSLFSCLSITSGKITIRRNINFIIFC